MLKANKENIRRADKVGYNKKESVFNPVHLKTNMDLLHKVDMCYTSVSDLRKRRLRSRKYYRGDQWSDRVQVNGVSISEEEYIRRQGKQALKQNMIRPPVRNVIGQYRSNPHKPVVISRNRQDQMAAEMMSCALDSVLFMNDFKERDARQMEEFLMSGMAIYKTSYQFDYERQRPIPKFRSVNPNRFFINTDIEDVCGEDVNFIGEIKDMTMNDVICEYAKNGVDEQDLKRIFNITDNVTITEGINSTRLDNLVTTMGDLNRCRVIEVWQMESEWRLLVHDYLDASYEIYPLNYKGQIEAENARRKEMSLSEGIEVPLIHFEQKYVKFWKTYHLAGNGYILFEAETPYEHNSHPYVFKLYPLIDGEVWGMVEDLIDQQKMVNRNIILYDFIISSSAKGVLLVPEECITDDFQLEDIAEEWVKYNGVIKIKAKNGIPLPQQISSNAVNIGMIDMIQMQLKFMQEISGVQGAIQGKSPNSGTAASLYAQETQNATLNVLDYMETYASFIAKRDKKVLQLIKQYFTEKQYIAVSDSDYSEEARNYDPDRIRNIDFDNTISKGKDTPSYRMLIDDMLLKLFESKAITIEMFLEHSSMPFSDKLLQSFKKMREQMQQGEMPEGAPEQLLNEMGGGNPQAQELLKNMM